MSGPLEQGRVPVTARGGLGESLPPNGTPPHAAGGLPPEPPDEVVDLRDLPREDPSSPDTGSGRRQPAPWRRNPAPADPPSAHLEEIAALVARAHDGDREAFAALYDRYVDRVYRYIYFRTLSAAVAEDLTSETFLRALRRFSSFHWEGRDIGAWFLTIARNLTLDHFKSSSFRLERSTADFTEADRPDEGIEDLVMSKLTAATVLAAVSELKSEQRECVTLRFLQGLNVAETARVMGRSEGAVKQLQFRAVGRLARLLAEPEVGVTGKP